MPSGPKSAKSTFGAAAYGGDGWSPRTQDHRSELGSIWAPHAVNSEWRPLRAVLLHRPGGELAAANSDTDAHQLLDRLDLGLAGKQHDAMAAAYKAAGVTVSYVEPQAQAQPNQMFCADLMFMTPEGAVLARPASTVRAGEERAVAARLAALGVPIFLTLHGNAVFEGADAMWLDEETVLVGRGLRTNQSAVEQITARLGPIGVEVLSCDMPFGTMHLMGMLRIFDKDLAVAWPRRTPHAAVMALRDRGYTVAFLPDDEEASLNRALNCVTLGPRRILMVAGNPTTQAFYEGLGVDCVTSPADELAKAAGAIGCLTGVLGRDQGP